MVAHACKPSTWKAETGGLNVQGQSGLQRPCLKKQKAQNKTIKDLHLNVYRHIILPKGKNIPDVHQLVNG
jgi:hypothetical protein